MFPYNMEDVLRISHISHNSGDSIRVFCPFCTGKKINKNLGITLSNEKFHCYSCGISGRGATNFYALLNNVSTKEAYREICDQMGITTNTNTVNRERPKPVYEKSIEPAIEVSDTEKNKTYRYFLDELHLSERHRTDLINRGFEDLEIQLLKYVSYPDGYSGGQDTIVPEYFNIPKKLLEKKCVLKGVPMFHKTKNKGVWTMCKRKDGIVVPYISFYNEIVGFQLRKNDEDLKVDEETGEKENKYSWLASGNQIEGCKARTRVHYACDFLWSTEKKQFYPLIPNKKIYITEGAMKGDLAHAISGLPIIALPGVTSALEDLSAQIPLLKQAGVEEIVIAYDMDRLFNINVTVGLFKIKKIFENAGFAVKEVSWEREMTNMRNEPFKCDVPSTFVFTAETLSKAIEEEELETVLEKVVNVGKTKVIFALENRNEVTKKNKELSLLLIDACKKHNLLCSPAFWNLKLKGIDDYYAYKKRGVKYV